MKSLLKVIQFFMLVMILNSCDGAGNEEYGSALIYMPQATIQSRGTNNNYTIELPSILHDTIIPVGVYRSGLQKLQAYNVDIVIDVDTLSKAIAWSTTDNAYKMYATAKLLPEEYYTLSQNISVKKGERSSWTNLVIKREQLFNAWTDNSDVYILPVRITNPSFYELNEQLSLTMFVLKKK